MRFCGRVLMDYSFALNQVVLVQHECTPYIGDCTSAPWGNCT